jgi:hypothetical protein
VPAEFSATAALPLTTGDPDDEEEDLAAMPRQRYSAPRITARMGASK